MRLLLNLLLPLALTANAQRFVRFISDDGKEYTGDAILPENSIDARFSTSANVIEGDLLGEFRVTKEVKKISKLLSPLDPIKTRTVRCVGFNYVDHDEETNITIPSFPILFFKPWTALAGPLDDVPVTQGYQNQSDGFVSSMDYEGELVVVIKDKIFNITADEALDHVLGYASGYDVSHRGWQIDRGGEPQPQFSMGKDADGWGPWGPALTAASEIPDPQTLFLQTHVNGALKQNATTADMIFGVADIVAFFSMGITLLPGDIIFTGTPGGTQLGMADPVWLTNGDNVTVTISELGSIQNQLKYT
jgi:2-keto-4-pentenoate hydratase/2-oxohepta-3-ene-1,7-dioic acid hydratase in catechol pathway